MKKQNYKYKHPSGTTFYTCFTSDFFLEDADYRLPIYLKLPIKHKAIMCEPLLERINLTKYLTPEIEMVSVGGESGLEARICEYEWILDIRNQCINANVSFDFHQTGAKLLKDGKLYRIPKAKQGVQALKAGINFNKDK